MKKNLLGILVVILISNLMFANCKSDNNTVKSGFEWGGDWTSCKDFQHFELIE